MKFTSRILEGLTLPRGLVEPRMGIGCGAAAADKKSPSRYAAGAKERGDAAAAASSHLVRLSRSWGRCNAERWVDYVASAAISWMRPTMQRRSLGDMICMNAVASEGPSELAKKSETYAS